MTSKERVLSTLNFTNTQERIPRQLWSLPWANEHCPDMMERTTWMNGAASSLISTGASSGK